MGVHVICGRGHQIPDTFGGLSRPTLPIHHSPVSAREAASQVGITEMGMAAGGRRPGVSVAEMAVGGWVGGGEALRGTANCLQWIE